tara:strand:+ start:94 stop:408 length:315 start_codon:yes stop_codon:yes gene_type:complete
MKNIETFERCNCYGTISLYELETSPKCGCGKDGCNCRLYRDQDVIHFRNEHWHSSCALEVVLKERLNLSDETLNKLRKKIEWEKVTDEQYVLKLMEKCPFPYGC